MKRPGRHKAIYEAALRALRLERLRFKQLLDWIACSVVDLLHDGSTPCVTLDG
jgi:hypothetical protein